MNKKIQEYFESKSFKINGDYAIGKIRGYEVNVFVNMKDVSSTIQMLISCHIPDDKLNDVGNELKAAKLKYFRFDFSHYGLTIGLNDLTLGKLLARMDDVFEIIFNILEKNNALNAMYCPVCGDELNPEATKVVTVDGLKITLDEKCVEEINEIIETQNEEFENAPNNYGKGFLGALIGAIVGAVAYVILFLIGYLSAICPFISICFGSYLYKKLGGKPNKMMIVIITLVSFVTIIAVCFIMHYIAGIGYAIEDGFTGSSADAFSYAMGISEFSGIFYYNMGFTAVITLVASAYEVFALSKSIKRSKGIQ